MLQIYAVCASGTHVGHPTLRSGSRQHKFSQAAQRIFTYSKRNTLAAIMVALLLGACSATKPNSDLVLTSTVTTDLKHTMAVQSNDATLQRLLAAAWQDQPQVVLASGEGYSDIRLEVLAQAQPLSTATQTPRAFGRVQTMPVQSSAFIRFRLVDSSGSVLHQGGFTAVGGSEQRFVGSLTTRNALTPVVAADAVATIMPQLQRPITALEWRTRVIAHQGPEHVVLGATELNGVQLRQQFKTATRPIAIVRVVTFDNPANGSPRAIARLMGGPLPQPGQILVPLEDTE